MSSLAWSGLSEFYNTSKPPSTLESWVIKEENTFFLVSGWRLFSFIFEELIFLCRANEDYVTIIVVCTIAAVIKVILLLEVALVIPAVGTVSGSPVYTSIGDSSCHRQLHPTYQG